MVAHHFVVDEIVDNIETCDVGLFFGRLLVRVAQHFLIARLHVGLHDGFAVYRGDYVRAFAVVASTYGENERYGQSCARGAGNEFGFAQESERGTIRRSVRCVLQTKSP